MRIPILRWLATGPLAWYPESVHSPLTAKDLLPLVARLDPSERKRLLTLLQQAGERDAALYQASPAKIGEFSSEGDPLSWDAEGWDQPT
jgi:PAS domain-containing protein